MAIATYNPGEVNLYLALLHQVTGFSPNTVIKISKDENLFETFSGGTGNVERLRHPDTTYTLEISLSQTSPSNTILNALATLDHLSGVGMFPIFAKDGSGDSLFIAGSCWIESPPEATYSNQIESRIWTVKCHELVFGLAGNGDSEALSRVAQLGAMVGQLGGNMGIF